VLTMIRFCVATVTFVHKKEKIYQRTRDNQGINTDKTASK
jgi:hypothetical protein